MIINLQCPKVDTDPASPACTQRYMGHMERKRDINGSTSKENADGDRSVLRSISTRAGVGMRG